MIAIILAAGKSTRMKTTTAKVLHQVCGTPMLDYVIAACRGAKAEKIYIVVGYGKEQIIEKYSSNKDIVFVEQNEQKGTGHAIICCKEQVGDFGGDTLILCGDGPMIKASTLLKISEEHRKQGNALTLGTAVLDNPFGYGRIVRDVDGNITEIVEQVECNDSQLKIKEVNPSYLCFDNQVLFSVLSMIKPSETKGEYYLTDAISLILKDGCKVSALNIVAQQEALSVNSRKQLSNVNKLMQQRIQAKLMAEGVTIVSPDNTWISSQAQIGKDTIIEPFVCIDGNAKIGCNCYVKPFVRIQDGAVLEDGCVYC